eukprot:COSAG01_NODE_7793_length_3054_cov_112.512014_4_plen_60_part_00
MSEKAWEKYGLSILGFRICEAVRFWSLGHLPAAGCRLLPYYPWCWSGRRRGVQVCKLRP